MNLSVIKHKFSVFSTLKCQIIGHVTQGNQKKNYLIFSESILLGKKRRPHLCSSDKSFALYSHLSTGGQK